MTKKCNFVLALVLICVFNSSLSLAAESCLLVGARILGADADSDASSAKLAAAAVAAAKGTAIPIADQGSIVAEAARSEVMRRSDTLKRMLDSNPDPSIRSVDVVILGGGTQTASALYPLGDARVLVINKSQYMGPFSRFGDTFYVNSAEETGKPSPNWMPVDVNPSDIANHNSIDISNKKYVAGRTLGNTTEINSATSKADFLMGEEVVSVHPDSHGHWVIKTANGHEFTAPNVIDMSGMGREKFPFDDVATQELIAREQMSGAPRIRFIDDFMADNQDVAHSGQLPLERYAGKRVLIMGKGDGGAIANEYVLGHGPPAGYAYRADEINSEMLPKTVFWLGHTAKTGDEYKAATWERYWDLAKDIDSGRLKTINGRGSRIVEITSGPEKGAFEVHYGPGEKDFVVVDEVVVAAGYDTSGPKTIAAGATGNSNDVQFQMVKGRPVNMDGEVNIAKQLVVDGKPVNYYIGGAATGGLDTPGLPGGPNSPRIEVLGARTSALAQKIRGTIANPRSCLTCVHSPSITVVPAAQEATHVVELSSPLKSIRVASEGERDALIQIRLTNLLNEIHTEKPIDVHIEPNYKTGGLSISSRDLSPADLQSVKKLIDSDNTLKARIALQAKTKIKKAIDIHLNKTTTEGNNPAVVFKYDGLVPNAFGVSELSGAIRASALSSPTGQKLMSEAMAHGMVDNEIIKHYEPQKFTTYCGIASSCIVMNAIDKVTATGARATQDDMLHGLHSIKPKTAVQGTTGGDWGTQLDQLPKILNAQGVTAIPVHADQPMVEGAQALRSAIKRQFDSTTGKQSKIIVNFHGQTLGTSTAGHFSPIGAYDASSDSVLIMDTAEHKNEPFWIPVNDLYYAMTKIDSNSKQSRGYLIIQK